MLWDANSDGLLDLVWGGSGSGSAVYVQVPGATGMAFARDALWSAALGAAGATSDIVPAVWECGKDSHVSLVVAAGGSILSLRPSTLTVLYNASGSLPVSRVAVGDVTGDGVVDVEACWC